MLLFIVYLVENLGNDINYLDVTDGLLFNLHASMCV